MSVKDEGRGGFQIFRPSICRLSNLPKNRLFLTKTLFLPASFAKGEEVSRCSIHPDSSLLTKNIIQNYRFSPTYSVTVTNMGTE